ncbi:MAG TPA: hypothetical protein VMW19_11715 [Myxococcota bacterium]|nr:hypothetical protein [Myxococcota bacterium]
MSAPTPTRDARATRVAGALLLLLLVGGLARAHALTWTCDDAFISFRYAQNLAHGDGLVYNAGERVEGYTNLLWTLALAAGAAAGLDPIHLAARLGLACYAGLALTLAGASWQRHRRRGLPFLPLAAAVALVSPDFHDWATGGLETALFGWLATASALAARGAARSSRRALGAGLLLSLLLLTRPDGLLFAVTTAATLVLWPPRDASARAARRGAAALLALPALCTAALVAWKLAYYGELLPTAFHSKSVLRPWYSQGLVYVGLYLAKNWLLAPALAAAVAARWLRPGAWSDVDRDGAAFAASALCFWLYVAHVGGDFMFARRLLPAVPLLLLAVEGELVQLPLRAARAATLTCVVAAALPYPVLGDRALWRGVADERRFYPPRALAARELQGRALHDALAGTGARVAYEGGMCAFGYFSELPWLAEMTGLTQYSLAKLPLTSRGRPGHEKRPTEDWLREQDVLFVVSQRFPPIARGPSEPYDLIHFGDIAVARIVRYDDAIMERLREREGVHFTPIEDVIEQSRREIERADRVGAERVYERLSRYYLDGAGPRGAAIAASLRAQIDSKPDAKSDP